VPRLLLVAILVVLAGPAEARRFKGDGPRTLAVGYGAVWVGHGDGTVTRVDAETMRARSTRLGSGMGGYSITSLAAGFGSVWVAPNGTPLHRIHPQTGRVTRRIWNLRGGWSPNLVSAGAGAVWAADYQRNAIFRVNPATNRIDGRKIMKHTVRSIQAGPRAVWVQTIPGRGPITGPEGPRIVSRLDPKTLRLRRAFRVACDASHLSVGVAVWVLDNCSGALRRFDVRRGAFGAPVQTAPGSLGLVRGFGSLWVSNGATVRRIDPARGVVLAQIRAEGPFLAAGAGFVWVLDWGDGGWLRRIDPRTNRLAGPALKLRLSRNDGGPRLRGPPPRSVLASADGD